MCKSELKPDIPEEFPSPHLFAKLTSVQHKPQFYDNEKLSSCIRNIDKQSTIRLKIIF